MNIVEIEFGPPTRSFGSFEEAIAGSKAEPKRVLAEADTLAIGNTIVSGGIFGESICVIAFQNGWNLRVEARQFIVGWSIHKELTHDIEAVDRKKLRFENGQEENYDPNKELAEIVGSEFVGIAVTGCNLLLYTRGNEIFWFGAWRNKLTKDELLHVCFET